ncbi:MAG: hypothetical protein ABIH20_00685 [Candidatus Diapherotrites archaeon]
MDNEKFRREVAEILKSRGITPNPAVLNKISSTNEEMAREFAQMSPLLGLHETIPSKEEVQLIKPYRIEIRAIVGLIMQENPGLRTPTWKGKVIISAILAKRIRKFANDFTRNKRLIQVEARREIADAIKSLAAGSGRAKYQKKTERILGLFEYIHDFAQNYRIRVGDISRYKTFLHKLSQKASGALTPKEGYFVYCSIVKHNPLLAAHHQEIENAKAMRKANIWTELHADNQAAAKKKRGPKRSARR